MEKYINDQGKECYRGVEESTNMVELDFLLVQDSDHHNEFYDRDLQYELHTNLGSLTVLDRRTGFGWRATETGFCSPDGLFWLASGDLDVRDSGAKTIGDAIKWVKKHASYCRGI